MAILPFFEPFSLDTNTWILISAGKLINNLGFHTKLFITGRKIVTNHSHWKDCETRLFNMSRYGIARSVTHNFSKRLNPIAQNLYRAPRPDRILFDKAKRPVSV